ncbi:hypothetical protein [Mannheimia indoligenes]|uniref:Uncharacterized protein n=1 Tax=Mannheimia indoligenes TaxID=3103145 RepID=A0ABU7ZBW1_9PAST
MLKKELITCVKTHQYCTKKKQLSSNIQPARFRRLKNKQAMKFAKISTNSTACQKD